MTSPKLKTFRVRFGLTYWYWIDVEADSKLSAIAKAENRALHHNNDRRVGFFVFDTDRSGNHGWEAEEVIP